jgi:hypothetical protein
MIPEKTDAMDADEVYNLSHLEDAGMKADAVPLLATDGIRKMVPIKNYYVHEMTKPERGSYRDNCRGCMSPLKDNGSKGRPAGVSPRLCTPCCVFGVALLEIEGFPKIDDLLNKAFIDRRLQVCINNEKLCHIKVYTCHDCAGPMHFTTPFKICIKCISGKWPVMVHKHTASIVLGTMLPLLDLPAVSPYLLRRRQLYTNLRDVKNKIYSVHDYDYGFRYNSCKIDNEDDQALKAAKQNRSLQISSNVDQLIPVLSDITAEYDVELACNPDGSLRGKKKSYACSDQEIATAIAAGIAASASASASGSIISLQEQRNREKQIQIEHQSKINKELMQKQDLILSVQIPIVLDKLRQLH